VFCVEIILNLVNLYLRYNIPLLKTLSRADRIANPGRYTPLVSTLEGLYTLSFLILLVFLAFIILNGYIHIVKKWKEHKTEPDWKDFFTWNFSLFGKYIVLLLHIGLRSILGYLFFILPGIMIQTKYIFAPYLLIEQKLNLKDSLGKSSKLAKGIRWQMFGLIFLYIVIIIGPAFFLIITFNYSDSDSLQSYDLYYGLFYLLIQHFSHLVLSHLYFDLSAQQVTPPIPLEALTYPEEQEKY
jgi:hypothetical protein